MLGLTTLWVPIVVSAIAVFVASSLVHMVLPWHKTDYGKLPNEDAVQAALRPFALPPGDYMVPRPAGPDDMKSAAFQEKVKAGPVMVVLPGLWATGTCSTCVPLLPEYGPA